MVKLVRKPGPAPGTPKVPGSGRKRGTPNKVSRELRQTAQKYTARCLRILIELAENSEDEAIRLKAAAELLDRGHGRPAQSQTHTGEDGSGPVRVEVTHQIVDPKVVEGECEVIPDGTLIGTHEQKANGARGG